jgi:hypothetical protein
VTYYGASDLAASLRLVRKNTLQIANELTEEQYSFVAAPGMRTVGQLLTHVAFIYRLQQQIHAVERRTTVAGFDFVAFIRGVVGEEAPPRTKAEVIELLTRGGESWSAWVEAQSEVPSASAVIASRASADEQEPLRDAVGDEGARDAPSRQLMLIQRMLGIVPHLTRELARMQPAR